MNINSSLSLLLLCCVLLPRGNAGETQPKKYKFHRGKIQTALEFSKRAGKIVFCPTGNCTTGKNIAIRLEKLFEVDANGKNIGNKAENFNSIDYVWSTPITKLVNDTNVTTTTLNATLRVGRKGKNEKSVQFIMTTAMYHKNATVKNGNTTLDVPAGSLKFSITLKDWPWKSGSNKLRFGVDVRVFGKNKQENNKFTNKINKRKKGRKGGRIKRLEFVDGLFMESPTTAVLDGKDSNITESIVPVNKRMEVDWVFPHFKSTLYYDPVFGDADRQDNDKDDDSPTIKKSDSCKVTMPSIILGSILSLIFYALS